MKKNYFFIAVIFTFFTQCINGQAVVTTFTTPGANTYTVDPGNVIIVVIDAWGGGGGGSSAVGVAGGGGGGAYARTTTSLSQGTYTVTVGSGGAAGVNGGASSFTALVVAAGGSSSTTIAGGTGGLASASTGTSKFDGGNGGAGGATGGFQSGGGGGGSALTGGAGSNGNPGAGGGSNVAGGTGGAGTGVGGEGANGNGTVDAAAGSTPGGGGGGRASGGGTSKAGAAGRVVVTVSAGGPLPIKVFYFNAAKSTGSYTLNWRAACNSTQATFEIERSVDGRNFTTINSITATQERCAQPFTFSDNNNIAGNVFYRIKVIDIEGKFDYTATVKLGGQQKDMRLAALLPNPVTNTAQLNIITAKKENVQLAIVSLEGKVVYRSNVQVQNGSSIVSVEVSGLAKGTYIIRGVFSDGETNAIKFIKQ